MSLQFNKEAAKIVFITIAKAPKCRPVVIFSGVKKKMRIR